MIIIRVLFISCSNKYDGKKVAIFFNLKFFDCIGTYVNHFTLQDHKELIDTASKDEWTLECDKKMLDIMQDLASVRNYFFL